MPVIYLTQVEAIPPDTNNGVKNMMYLRQARAALESLEQDARETAINCINAAVVKHQVTVTRSEKRKPKFTVNNQLEKNPYNYRAGGADVDFHYYSFSACGRMATLRNSDKVKVMTLQGEALEEFYRLIEE